MLEKNIDIGLLESLNISWDARYLSEKRTKFIADKLPSGNILVIAEKDGEYFLKVAKGEDPIKCTDPPYTNEERGEFSNGNLFGVVNKGNRVDSDVLHDLMLSKLLDEKGFEARIYKYYSRNR